MIDLSPSTRREPSTRMRAPARAGGGCTWAVFDDATHSHGLATTGGIIGLHRCRRPDPRAAGSATSPASTGCPATTSCRPRSSPPTGRCVTASETRTPTCSGRCGAAAATSASSPTFEFRLHPVAEVYGGPIAYPVDRADERAALLPRVHRAKRPRSSVGFVGFHLAPPLPFLPEEWHFEPVCVAVACWAGPNRAGPAEMVQPFFDVVAGGRLRGHDAVPHAQHGLRRAAPGRPAALLEVELHRELSDATIAAHVEYGSKVPSIQTAVHLYAINGAVQRVASDATAFAYRDVDFARSVIAGMWEDPADNDANIAWVRDDFRPLEPYSAEGGYINFMDHDDQDRVGTNYRGDYERLVAVKSKYDPDNVFHLNQNIKPAT